MNKKLYGLEKKQWKITGSTGKTYFVHYTPVYSRNTWACMCTGYRFRKKCVHIDRIKVGQMISKGINPSKHYGKEQLKKIGSIQTLWLC